MLLAPCPRPMVFGQTIPAGPQAAMRPGTVLMAGSADNEHVRQCVAQLAAKRHGLTPATVGALFLLCLGGSATPKGPRTTGGWRTH